MSLAYKVCLKLSHITYPLIRSNHGKRRSTIKKKQDLARDIRKDPSPAQEKKEDSESKVCVTPLPGNESFNPEVLMIARLWHGVTEARSVDDYLAYLRKTGIPDYAATPGNRGVSVLVRNENERAHFLLISYWESYDAIRRFAGDEIEMARYYPEDKQWLLELEPYVIHYDVAEEVRP